ncbi:MAG TPA: hypothetical protein VK989_04090 [Polyangia bacterium]|jgi:hypothetical protein|nr:hypothetical protein [Polyangia bacterium]
MGDDSVPEIVIDGEVTEATSSPTGTTRPHATVEWLGGFEEGRRRGAADVLDALAAALAQVGVPADVAAAIVTKVRDRAGVMGG